MQKLIGFDNVEQSHDENEQNSRRSFLKTGLVVAAATQLWWPTIAQAKEVNTGREVNFINAHTGEKFQGEYWYKGRYNPDAFREIKKVMRDHRNGQKFPIDPRLMDVLFVLQRRVDNKKPYEMLSGYRSPATNAKLRRTTAGVAKKSLHMMGQAVDIRLPGTRLSSVRREAVSLKAGGVGYYPKSGFLHIDTGRIRHW